MAEIMREESAQAAFNTAASNEVRAQARQALQTMVREYNRQSEALAKVVRGHTEYQSSSADENMADKLTAHLETLGFQINVQSLVCARLDGVDVGNMMNEIESLMDKRHGGRSPTPRRG